VVDHEPRTAAAPPPGAGHAVQLLSRAGCSLCAQAAGQLAALADELGFTFSVVDVDAEAAAGQTALRAEFGDLLPVVLLDGVQHSYWEVDEQGLRDALRAS
jgi:glutaredoxin